MKYPSLALKGIAGIYAMSALIEHELAEHPLQAEIMNEAERRTLGCLDYLHYPLLTYAQVVARACRRWVACHCGAADVYWARWS